MRAIILPLLGVLSSTPALADEGGVLFRQNCATCHGIEARGTGPMAEILAINAPDLTLLSARNGGTFPTVQVIERIEGETIPLAHGGPMPIFGMSLTGPSVAVDLPDGAVVSTSAPILAIVEWLMDNQR